MKLKIAFITTVDGGGNPQIGDCIVITFKNKFTDGNRLACIIIDGGYTSNSRLIHDYLVGEKVEIIDLIVATHIDNDHISGLRAFAKDYLLHDVEKFKLMNYWGPAPKAFSEPVTITEFISFFPDLNEAGINELSMIAQSVGENEELYKLIEEILPPDHIFHPSVNVLDSIPKIFSDIDVEILAPDQQIQSADIKTSSNPDIILGDSFAADTHIDLNEITAVEKLKSTALTEDRTANNQSIVIKLIPLNRSGERNEACSILLPGDAEIESWDFMIDKWGQNLKSRILKLSHHGSKNGTTEDILDRVKPEYCIICAGDNTHGLPDDETLKLMSKNNIDFYCTGRNSKQAKKKSPCIDAEIIKDCPRWDVNEEEHVKDTIIFNIDSDKNKIDIIGKACGVNRAGN